MQGLKYISWHDHSGYSVAARRYLSALIDHKIPLTWTPMFPGQGWGRAFYYQPFSGPSTGDSLLDPYCNARIPYDTVLVHLVPEYFPRWKAQEPGKRLIGYTTWETDLLPVHWPDLLNQMDEIWVPSRWNRDVFCASGVNVPVKVLPHILKDPLKDSLSSSLPLGVEIPTDHFVFYSINVWSQRKALELLLQTYWNTFTVSDPVTMILKTSEIDRTHPFRDSHFPLHYFARTDRTVRRLAKDYPNRPSTHLITKENVSEEVIDALHARGDAYVSLSHAEGWGLGAFDAVAEGNPVMMTGYGGPLDYLDPEAAGLVDCQDVPVVDPRNPNFSGPDHHWAAPDLSQAAQWMRRFYEDPKDARHRGERLRDYARSYFRKETVLGTMLDYLEGTPYSL